MLEWDVFINNTWVGTILEVSESKARVAGLLQFFPECGDRLTVRKRDR